VRLRDVPTADDANVNRHKCRAVLSYSGPHGIPTKPERQFGVESALFPLHSTHLPAVR
jgi:hypothetical protein